MILIVSNERDLHARRVAQEIIACGGQAHLVDMTGLGRDTTLSYALQAARTPSAVLTTRGQNPLRLDDVRAVWHRRPASPSIAPAVLRRNERNFAWHEWMDAFNGVLLSQGCRYVNSPVAQAAATKPRQLRAAQDVALSIPATLITNDPEAARDFIHAHHGRVVHKCLTAPERELLDTRRWHPDDVRHLPDLELAPVILQQEIVGPADIRATIVGSDIFAARFETGTDGPVDARLNLDVPCRPCSLPEDVAQRLLQLMNNLGLVFGTVDLKVAHDGTHVFLEVNPQGQFLYVEILSGLPICAALASLLTRGAAEPVR